MAEHYIGISMEYVPEFKTETAIFAWQWLAEMYQVNFPFLICLTCM